MQPIDAVGVLAQPGEVGQDQVDAEHVELGEHQPAVEEQELAVLLEHHAVAADLAEAAEERDGDGSGHGCGSAEEAEALEHPARLVLEAVGRRARSGGGTGRPGWPSTRSSAFTARANWAISRLS